jgi:hypothetical protein
MEAALSTGADFGLALERQSEESFSNPSSP